MDAFQRTPFPGGGDSVDDMLVAFTRYRPRAESDGVEMVSAAIAQHDLRVTPDDTLHASQKRRIVSDRECFEPSHAEQSRERQPNCPS
jgi:hypothetical protein